MKNKTLNSTLSIILAVFVWEIASLAIGEELYLPSPMAVFSEMIELVLRSDFLLIVLTTISKIVIGFGLAGLGGFLLAMACVRWEPLEILVHPYITFLKSIPVVSFILLCLLWVSKDLLPIVIVSMVNLPIIYTNVLNGIKSTDIKLLELASIYKMSYLSVLKYIFFPAMKPHLFSATYLASGIAVKSAIAAEIIGLPHISVGNSLMSAKIYLETRELFAWTVIIFIISYMFEKLAAYLLKAFYVVLES
jgi:NitT/TauT family transport system permease protein